MPECIFKNDNNINILLPICGLSNMNLLIIF